MVLVTYCRYLAATQRQRYIYNTECMHACSVRGVESLVYGPCRPMEHVHVANIALQQLLILVLKSQCLPACLVAANSSIRNQTDAQQ